jgi:ribosome production factor 2
MGKMTKKRVARLLKKKEPQLVEGPKTLLAIRGPSTSEISLNAMRDIAALKQPDVKMLSRKNDFRPFEDITSLEFLSEKNDASAFLYISHNKKRPHNMVLGRMYDYHLLDMVELGILGYASINDYTGPKKMLGSFPLMLFQGEEWSRLPEFIKLKSLFLDIFAPVGVDGVSLQGIDHVISLTSFDSKYVSFRAYFVQFKKGQGKIPHTELVAMGPSIDFVLRRTQFASADLEKLAMKVPKQLKVTKTKNITTNVFGETLGQVHMERQDFDKLQLKKNKALKSDLRNRKKRKLAAEAENDDDDMQEA